MSYIKDISAQVDLSYINEFVKFSKDTKFKSLTTKLNNHHLTIQQNLKVNGDAVLVKDGDWLKPVTLNCSKINIAVNTKFSSSQTIYFRDHLNDNVPGGTNILSINGSSFPGGPGVLIGGNPFGPTSNIALDIAGAAIFSPSSMPSQFLQFRNKNTNTIFAWTERVFASVDSFNIGGSTVDSGLSVRGDFAFNPSVDSTLFVSSDDGRVTIGGSIPEARLSVWHAYPSVATNFYKKIDPNTLFLIESGPNPLIDTNSMFQIIGPWDPSEDSYFNSNLYGQGILFTGAGISTSTNAQWLINPQWDSVGTILEPGVVFDNNLNFSYLSSSTNNPLTTIFSSAGYILAYIRAEAAPVDNIDFTGQHRCEPAIENLNYYSDKVGLIVVSDGTYCLSLGDDNTNIVSINEAIPKIKLSNTRNDKKVFGVISDYEDTENKRSYSTGRFASTYIKKQDDHRLIINSLGEGGIWICNINGNLENGDYITTCEIAGFGMKQDAPNIKNYTVAKITCDCDFNLSSSLYKCEEFQFSGSTYRKAFVGCTYHCG